MGHSGCAMGSLEPARFNEQVPALPEPGNRSRDHPALDVEAVVPSVERHSRLVNAGFMGHAAD